MNVVTEFGARVKKVITKPAMTMEGLDAAVAKAEAALAEAGNVVMRAKNDLTAQFDDLADAGDEVGLRRVRDAIAQAERLERDATADLALHRGRLEKARARDEDGTHAQLRIDVDRLGQLLYQRAQMIREAEEELAKQLEEYQIVAVDLQRKSDELLVSTRLRAGNDPKLPTAVYVADFKPLFGIADILHLVALDLYVMTNGRWPHKNIGLDVYTLSQGPRFDNRVQGYLQMLLRQLPQVPTDLPPVAA
jgi:hypothetical protein